MSSLSPSTSFTISSTTPTTTTPTPTPTPLATPSTTPPIPSQTRRFGRPPPGPGIENDRGGGGGSPHGPSSATYIGTIVGILVVVFSFFWYKRLRSRSRTGGTGSAGMRQWDEMRMGELREATGAGAGAMRARRRLGRAEERPVVWDLWVGDVRGGGGPGVNGWYEKAEGHENREKADGKTRGWAWWSWGDVMPISARRFAIDEGSDKVDDDEKVEASEMDSRSGLQIEVAILMPAPGRAQNNARSTDEKREKGLSQSSGVVEYVIGVCECVWEQE